MTSYIFTWIPLDDNTDDAMSIHNMPLYSHLCSVVLTPACGSALASASGSALASASGSALASASGSALGSANVRPCITNVLLCVVKYVIFISKGTFQVW